MKTVIVTGSQGLIGSYLVNHLIRSGYFVYGIDNFSKYGKVIRSHDSNSNFKLVECDLSKSFPELDADYLIAGAAMIGGISYFHKFAYDLLATNEKICCNTFDAAIRMKNLKRIVVLSSSMVFENTKEFPSPESAVKTSPPPDSSYGFQKLSTEYFSKAAHEQYGLRYTIIRPFNCIGVGEDDAISKSDMLSGNIKLTLSHVAPDLILKTLQGQDPLHILGSGDQVRCFTNGKDIARGTVMAMESEKAENNDFNISTNETTRIIDLAKIIWKKINRDRPFNYVSDPPFRHDIQYRMPDTKKAKEILGFTAQYSLDETLDEVIAYIRKTKMHCS
jgi:nucleoside-diphosphate-sugar epimerase